MPRLYIIWSLVLGVIETCLFTFCEGQQYEIMPHYIKKSQTRPQKYNQNRNQEMYKLRSARKSDIFDYNYEDWEDKKPDYYNFFMNTSDAMNTQTQTTQTANTLTTTQHTSSDITSPTEDNKPTETVHNTTLAKKTETQPETEVTFSAVTTLSSTPSTSQIPEFPDLTEDIFQPTTMSVPTTTKPVRNPIVNEIIQVQRETRGGYFTSGLIVSLKKITEKKSEDLEPLLTGLHNEVLRLNSKEELMMFGYVVSETLTSMVQLASTFPGDIIKSEATNGMSVLLNRREELSPDWNAIMDVADAIFIEDDLRNVANFLRDVQKYPNTTKAAIDIAHDAIRALIIIPYERIEGTGKEKLLIQEIKNAVKHRVYEDKDIGRRQVGGAAEERKLSTKKYTKEVEKFIFRTKTTTQPTSSTVYTEYVRNATIISRLKRKMRLYKEKFRLINKKERGSSRRGPTTTKTTTTSAPPMHKSNYYIRKYVKKDLYKMTTTTKKTTVYKIRYYGKIRKFNINSDTQSGFTNKDIHYGSDIEGYYSDTEYNNDNIQTDVSSETEQSKHRQDFETDNVAQMKPLFEDSNKKIDNRLYTRTDPTTILDVSNVNTDKYLKTKINKLTNSETDVADEDYLKANINNAMFHKGNLKTINNKRRFLTDVKDIYDSDIDYEVELKRNIYKVMINPKL
ncbi:uncharacterized protein LOC126779929 [Nymphalis io]|uniref:uncharacterized protein LOC126779929 n=1 Tax=Inachis io TaxID=171585 RepID=UPI002166EA11|nr:uncharacterized protein LOC126779929 [Nymphalis io]